MKKKDLRWGAAAACGAFSGYLFIVSLLVLISKTYAQQKVYYGYLFETPWIAPVMSLLFALLAVAIAIWPKIKNRIVR